MVFILFMTFSFQYDTECTQLVQNVDQLVVKRISFEFIVLLFLDFLLFCVYLWTLIFAGVPVQRLFFLLIDEPPDRVTQSPSHLLNLDIFLSHWFNLFSTFNLYLPTDWFTDSLFLTDDQNAFIFLHFKLLICSLSIH